MNVIKTTTRSDLERRLVGIAVLCCVAAVATLIAMVLL